MQTHDVPCLGRVLCFLAIMTFHAENEFRAFIIHIHVEYGGMDDLRCYAEVTQTITVASFSFLNR